MLLLSAALNGGMGWLDIFAAANMAAGLAYDVRIIAELYFEAAQSAPRLAGGAGYAFGAMLNVAGTLLFGIAPDLALSLIHSGQLLH